MTVRLSPFGPKPAFNDSSGNPLAGGKLYFFVNGSTTPQNTYTDSTGGVANANPVVLNARGEPTNEIWFTEGLTYKAVLKTSADVTIWSVDNITAIGDFSVVDEWKASGKTPTYVSATSFTLSGDQTTEFHIGRRLKSTNTGGTIYSTVTGSSFAASTTTITVANDSGSLDSGLSAVSYGLLRVTNPSVAKLRDLISVRDFNGVIDGVTSDTTADLAAVAAAQARGGQTVFYPGQVLTGGVVQRGGQRWVDASFPTIKRQARWAYRADTFAANGEGTTGFQALSINGTLIAGTLTNFLATATPDVVTMSGWGLRGAGGTNPLIVSNFGSWFENNTAVVWTQEIDVNNEGATKAEADQTGGVGIAINTGSTYSPAEAIDIRRYTGAGTGPGFLQGIVIAGARNTGLRIEAMDTTTYTTLSPAAPGTIQAIQVLKSSDSNLRWLLDQDGGMSWGPGNTAADVTLTRSASGVLQVGGAISDTVAWATTTPTPTAAAGTFTTVSATLRWNQIGKRVFFSLKVTITTNNTASGSVLVTLPVSAKTTMTQVAHGRADGVSGKMLQATISGTTLAIFNYDNTYPGANGEILLVGGVYEAA